MKEITDGLVKLSLVHLRGVHIRDASGNRLYNSLRVRFSIAGQQIADVCGLNRALFRMIGQVFLVFQFSPLFISESAPYRGQVHPGVGIGSINGENLLKIGASLLKSVRRRIQEPMVKQQTDVIRLESQCFIQGSDSGWYGVISRLSESQGNGGLNVRRILI